MRSNWSLEKIITIPFNEESSETTIIVQNDFSNKLARLLSGRTGYFLVNHIEQGGNIAPVVEAIKKHKQSNCKELYDPVLVPLDVVPFSIPQCYSSMGLRPHEKYTFLHCFDKDDTNAFKWTALAEYNATAHSTQYALIENVFSRIDKRYAGHGTEPGMKFLSKLQRNAQFRFLCKEYCRTLVSTILKAYDDMRANQDRTSGMFAIAKHSKAISEIRTIGEQYLKEMPAL